MASSGDKSPPVRGDFLDLIADPLRLRVVRFLEEHGKASLPELAEAAGVHANTLRPHVLELEAAGMLEAERRVLPSRRGRPGIDYRLARGWDSSGADYLGVAELLAAALGRVGLDSDQLRAVGEEWGRYLLGRPGTYDVQSELPRVLAQLGFEVSINGQRMQLSRCPCSTVAPDRPEIMCALTEGVIKGALSAAGSAREAVAFDHKPEQRRCSAKLIRRS
ncbi:MAG TPA: helix-turn-helix domain-containing protein [Candidatus Dormibacteraeota bacterium]|nr:helix-turn-helix domain-containing protein [Candidatus Dormibacteraeota bacterium]